MEEKLKEKWRKMKKIQASVIKGLMKISSQTFNSFILELSSILSLSHTLSHLEYSWITLAYIIFGERRQRRKENAREHVDKKL